MQLTGARDAVFRSWFNERAKYYRKMNQIPDDLGTAVNVQAMVFGNLGETSATGVGFTRNPGHRREGLLRRVPGERAGRRRGRRHPHAAPHQRPRKVECRVYNQLKDITTSLENHYRDIQDFEFTIQDGTLYMLQTRNGKRTGPAAVRIAVEMVEREASSARRKLSCASIPQQLDQLLHPVLDPKSKKELTLLAKGLAGFPGRFRRHDRVHRRGRGRSFEEGSRDSGPQGNPARRYPGHGSLQGHSDLARRYDQPRSGRLPRHGHPLRRRRRIRHRRRAQEAGLRHRQRQADHPEGRRLDLARWLHR